MNKGKTKWKVLLLTVLLAAVSVIWCVTKGQAYTLEVAVMGEVSSVDDVKIEIRQDNGTDIVRGTDSRLEDGVLKLRLQSIEEGQTEITFCDKSGMQFMSVPVYVHLFGIITVHHFLGDSNGGVIIPVAASVWLFCVLALLIRGYRKNSRENMYQYKNIAYLGLVIFLAFALVNLVVEIFSYQGLIHIIYKTLGLFSAFSMLTLPIAFVVAVFVILSNLILVKKEGRNIQNLLGLILGCLICFATIFPNLLYQLLCAVPGVDIHNQSGMAANAQLFVEILTYCMVSYLECILLATIIYGVKAARHIPVCNKDYILILGCQIKKDGTLTNLLKGRVDRALAFYHMQKERTGKALKFVPSGGQGSDEIMSEAEAMKRYLLQQGIKEHQILVEDKSKNTWENIQFSHALIQDENKNAKIAFSTTNYHVFRAGAIASSQNIAMEGIGAKTRTYFWVNAFIREFVAVLVAEKRKHMAVIGGIAVVVLVMIGLLYRSELL